MHSENSLINPIADWKKDIPKRKMQIPENKQPSQLISIKEKALAALAINWHFGRFPENRTEIIFTYGEQATHWKSQRANLMSTETWSVSDKDTVRELLLKLSDDLPNPPRSRLNRHERRMVTKTVAFLLARSTPRL